MPLVSKPGVRKPKFLKELLTRSPKSEYRAQDGNLTRLDPVFARQDYFGLKIVSPVHLAQHGAQAYIVYSGACEKITATKSPDESNMARRSRWCSTRNNPQRKSTIRLIQFLYKWQLASSMTGALP